MLTVVAGILERDGKVLICQRRPDGAHPLKWEFPGGKVESGEEPTAALSRELREELGIAARIGAEFARYEYAYPGKASIQLLFFSVTEFAGEIRNLVFERIEWCQRSQLDRYDFLEGDLALIQLIGKVEINQIE
ncbi:MAG: hydrolase [Bryobacterales bacterium]|nr:hydrolase [Bryobacterales bacterium]